MMRFRFLRVSALLAALLAACGGGAPSSSMLVRAKPGASVAPSTRPSATVDDRSDEIALTKLQRAAEDAFAAGVTDVAASLAARAWSLARASKDPRAEKMLALRIDALLASGERSLAVRVANDTRPALTTLATGAATAREIDARIAAAAAELTLPKTLAPTAVAPSLLSAYQLDRDGRSDAAALALAPSLPTLADPYLLAQIAAILERAGQAREARLMRSRARSMFRRMGGRIDLVAVNTWYTEAATFVGDHLALSKLLTPIEVVGPESQPAAAIELWSIDGRGKRISRAVSPARTARVAKTDDDMLVRIEREEARPGGDVVVREPLSGVVLRRFPTGLADAPSSLLVAGTVDRMLVLTTSGHEGKLFDAAGKTLATYEIAGTTPTITRVYRVGRGTEHDNILRDSPSWIVSSALAHNERYVAFGSSDSKVHLFDRVTKRHVELAHKWTYTEHRTMGGNPDLNVAVDLRFDARGETLSAIFRHGELLTWNTRDGRLTSTLPGTCSVDEAEKVAARYDEKPTPHPTPTLAERETCAWVHAGKFDPTGGRIASTGSAVRVRDAHDGKPLGILVDQVLSDIIVAWSARGVLAMVDIYGTVGRWDMGATSTKRVVPSAPSGPITPVMAADGRHVAFASDGRMYGWDLVEMSPLRVDASGLSFLALSDDGRRYVRLGKGAVEVVEVSTGAALSSYPVSVGASVYAVISGNGDKLLLRTYDGKTTKISYCEARSPSCRDLSTATGYGVMAISHDGRYVSFEAADGKTHIWEAASARSVRSLGQHVARVRFSGDDAHVAWVTKHPEDRKLTLNVAPIDGAGGSPKKLELDEWEAAIEPNADASMLLAVSGQNLRRWTVRTGAVATIEDLGFIGGHDIRLAANGKTLLLPGYDTIRVYDHAGFEDGKSKPARKLASAYFFGDGEVMVKTESGAVDGTAAAADDVVTWVARGADRVAFDGWLGWDAARVPRAWSSVMSGAEVVPPFVPPSD